MTRRAGATASARLAAKFGWYPPSTGYTGRIIAEVAQLVERNLAKVEVAGSNPVFRSAGRPLLETRKLTSSNPRNPYWDDLVGLGDVAEWLGTALQKLLHRFDSGRRLDA